MAKTHGRIEQALLENDALPPAQRRSPQEIADSLGVLRDSVDVCASRMRKAWRLAPSERQFTRTALPPRPAPPRDDGNATGDGAPDPETLLAGLEVLTPTQRRLELSRLALTGPAPVRVASIGALETMDRQSGRQVGPPEPVDDAEYVERLARLVYAAGEKIGEQAVAKAREKWTAEAERAPGFMEPTTSRNEA